MYNATLDLGSFMLSLIAIHMAARPKSQKMSFGWHRAEVLGATVSILAIWLVTGTDLITEFFLIALQ